jgi:hypothetical protein
MPDPEANFSMVSHKSDGIRMVLFMDTTFFISKDCILSTSTTHSIPNASSGKQANMQALMNASKKRLQYARC